MNAGVNISTCANQSTAQLTGVVNNATGGVWSGGSGTFNPSNTNLNATYTPTLGEIAAGTVTLTLSSTGNGLCNGVSDQVLITIAPAPVVIAGVDQTVCSNNSNVQMAGSVSNAGGGIWSGGTGTFSPSINALNAMYTPSTSELANGSVTLTLSSTGNGSCASVSGSRNNDLFLAEPCGQRWSGSHRVRERSNGDPERLRDHRNWRCLERRWWIFHSEREHLERDLSPEPC